MLGKIQSLVIAAEAERITNCIQRPEATLFDYLDDEYFDLEDQLTEDERIKLDGHTAQVQVFGISCEIGWRTTHG